MLYLHVSNIYNSGWNGSDLGEKTGIDVIIYSGSGSGDKEA